MKKKNGGWVSLLVALMLAHCAGMREVRVSPSQHQRNLESFEKAWSLVNETYWDPSFGGLDWQAVHDEFRPQAEAARTMEASRQVIESMLDRLGKSHFGVIPSELYRDLEPERGVLAGETGIVPRVIDGEALVVSVDEDSPAGRLGVRRGWEILAIDGTPVQPKLEALSGRIEESPRKTAILTSAVSYGLHGEVGASINVEFLDGNNERIGFDIPLEKERGASIALGYLPETRVWLDSKRIEGNIGYISFNAFIHPSVVMKGFNDAMESFADADGIIIDIRGNGGGMLAMVSGMAGWLVQERREAGKIFLRDQELALLLEPRATNYPGPVAILVDELCASASEAFSGSLQEVDRAAIVGSRTMGAVLGARLEKLPNGDGLMFAVVNFQTASGEELEGVGVEPDIEVHLTREALLQGRDPVLEAAQEWIRQQSMVEN